MHEAPFSTYTSPIPHNIASHSKVTRAQEWQPRFFLIHVHSFENYLN